MGIRTPVRTTRQAAQPVGRQKPQRIPALVPPGVRNLPPLEDHVIDRALSETSAGREAGMPGPDDDCGELFDGFAPAVAPGGIQTTSTLTFTGFVMTS